MQIAIVEDMIRGRNKVAANNFRRLFTIYCDLNPIRIQYCSIFSFLLNLFAWQLLLCFRKRTSKLLEHVSKPFEQSIEYVQNKTEIRNTLHCVWQPITSAFRQACCPLIVLGIILMKRARISRWNKNVCGVITATLASMTNVWS